MRKFILLFFVSSCIAQITPIQPVRIMLMDSITAVRITGMYSDYQALSPIRISKKYWGLQESIKTDKTYQAALRVFQYLPVRVVTFRDSLPHVVTNPPVNIVLPFNPDTLRLPIRPYNPKDDEVVGATANPPHDNAVRNRK